MKCEFARHVCKLCGQRGHRLEGFDAPLVLVNWSLMVGLTGLIPDRVFFEVPISRQ